MIARGLIGAVLVAAALTGAACGDVSPTPAGSTEPADAEPDTTPAEPRVVEAPDVTGLRVKRARRKLRRAGLEYSYRDEPADPSLCTVKDQSPVGEAAEGSVVELSLDCKVDVPLVVGETAKRGKAEVQDAGVRAKFDSKPDDLSLCSVADQSDSGRIEAGTKVVLTLQCDEPPPPPRPQAQPEPPPDQPSSDCDPNYEGACLDPSSSDYDCEGGSGNGPDYVAGPIQVVGDDPFGLDRDGDGVACE